MQKQHPERTAPKVSKPIRYRLYLEVTNAKGKKQQETFVSKATDEDFARAEIRREFKYFAYDHKWDVEFKIKRIAKLKIK